MLITGGKVKGKCRKDGRKSRNGGERGLVKRRVNGFEGGLALSVAESENGRKKCGRNTIR